MNTSPEADDTPEADSKPKKQVSFQRRFISWVFIAILLVIVFFEWQAKSSQANTVKGLEAALDQVGDVGEIPFTQFDTIKVGKTSEEMDDSGAINKLYHYRWNGIFKTYNLRLLVNDEDMIFAYDQQPEGEEVAGIKRISKKNLEALVNQNKKGASKDPVEEKQADTKNEASGEQSEK